MSHEQEDHVDEVKAEGTQTKFWTTARVCVGLILAGFVLVLAFLYRDNTHLQTRLHETEQAAIGAKARLAQITTQGISSDNQPGTPPSATPTTSPSPSPTPTPSPSTSPSTSPSATPPPNPTSDDSIYKRKYVSSEDFYRVLGEPTSERTSKGTDFDYAALRCVIYEKNMSEGWNVAIKELEAESDLLSKNTAKMLYSLKQAMYAANAANRGVSVDNEVRAALYLPTLGETPPIFFNEIPERIYISRSAKGTILNIKIHGPDNVFFGHGPLFDRYNQGDDKVKGLAECVFTKPELKKITHLRLIHEFDEIDTYGKRTKYLDTIFFISRKDVDKIVDWNLVGMSGFLQKEYDYRWSLFKKDAE